jgi:hypothetical protein
MITFFEKRRSYCVRMKSTFLTFSYFFKTKIRRQYKCFSCVERRSTYNSNCFCFLMIIIIYLIFSYFLNEIFIYLVSLFDSHNEYANQYLKEMLFDLDVSFKKKKLLKNFFSISERKRKCTVKGKYKQKQGNHFF